MGGIGPYPTLVCAPIVSRRGTSVLWMDSSTPVGMRCSIDGSSGHRSQTRPFDGALGSHSEDFSPTFKKGPKKSFYTVIKNHSGYTVTLVLWVERQSLQTIYGMGNDLITISLVETSLRHTSCAGHAAGSAYKAHALACIQWQFDRNVCPSGLKSEEMVSPLLEPGLQCNSNVLCHVGDYLSRPFMVWGTL